MTCKMKKKLLLVLLLIIMSAYQKPISKKVIILDKITVEYIF